MACVGSGHGNRRFTTLVHSQTQVVDEIAKNTASEASSRTLRGPMKIPGICMKTIIDEKICQKTQCSGYPRLQSLCVAAASLLFLITFPLVSSGRDNQSGDIAAKVFNSAASSVFVVSVRNDKGGLISLGTGFLVEKNTLATNLHVVKGGQHVFVEVGAARLPATIQKRDAKNDLAIISVEAEISANPLHLADSGGVPGQSIFVIGNPEGLENTISSGIVSGRRELDGRELLQISAPISHGSSGGPVLDASSSVVGVAAAMLRDGQNLNFAVPVKALRQLLSAERSPDALTDTDNVQAPSADESYSAKLEKYVANQMWPEARELLLEGIADDEFDANLRFALGQVLLEMGNWKDAVDQLSLSERLDSKLWQAVDGLARAYLTAWDATGELSYRTSACDAFDQLATYRPEDAGTGLVGPVALLARHPNDLDFAQIRAREAVRRLRSPEGLWKGHDGLTYTLGTAQGGWFFHPEPTNPDKPLDSGFKLGDFEQNEATGTGYFQVGDCVGEIVAKAKVEKCGSAMVITGVATGNAGSMETANHKAHVRACRSFFTEMAEGLAGGPAFELRLTRILTNGEAQWIEEK